MKYAATTTVTPERSRAEIEKILTRYGATGFMYGWQEDGAIVGFMLSGTQYRATISAPQRKNFEKGAGGRRRNNSQVKLALEQATKQSWRALALIIKAKLEWLEDRSHKPEEEFLPWMVMPDGRTFSEWAVPQIEIMKSEHKMPMLMMGSTDGNNIIEGNVKE